MSLIKRINEGVANEVYLIELNHQKYILKKYLYKYDFSLQKELYRILEANNINYLAQECFIETFNNVYGLFRYLENQNIEINLDNFFIDYLKINRKTNIDNTFENKIERYIKGIENSGERIIDDILNIYSRLSINEFYKEKYLNHGDLSKGNLIINDNKIYLIDFDETIVTSPLYDYAVICIKNYFNCIEYFEDMVNASLKIPKEELRNATKVYLCKILIEKFYYKVNHNLDLESEIQKRDYYGKYVKILKRI